MRGGWIRKVRLLIPRKPLNEHCHLVRKEFLFVTKKSESRCDEYLLRLFALLVSDS